MENKIRVASIVGLVANICLFLIKAAAGFLSNSIAVISDAANSFQDIFSSIVIYIAVKQSHKKADSCHPFGHHSAEPIAALIIAILTGILGFELLRESIFRIINPPKSIINILVISALIIAILTKLVLYFYYNKLSSNSPATKAYKIDSRNDVLTSSVALIGIILEKELFNGFDSIIGILISIYIFYSGYNLAKENLTFLMGSSPNKTFIDKLRNKALIIKGVIGVNTIRAYYLGNQIQVELHAEVDENISTKKSHKICKEIEYSIEKNNRVNKAFIHIDPIKKK